MREDPHMFMPLKPQFHSAPDITHRKFNPSQRALSSEIEVAGTASGGNINAATAVYKWGGAIVHDGSLPDRGFEINTAPAAGDYWIKEIEEICAGLAKDSAYADSSCGAHLHIDARDFTHYDMRRLILLYGKLEDGIYALADPSRRSNRYCIPCAGNYLKFIATGKMPKSTKTPGAQNKENILRGLYRIEKLDKHITERKGGKYDGSRYNGLNLHSWMYRGSLECRVLHGTVDPEEITNWGLMWSAILDFAYRAKEQEIVALRGDPNSLIDTVCDTQGVNISDWMKKQRARFFRR